MRKIIILLLLLCVGLTARAQKVISLNDAILIAQQNSYDAQLARFSFLSSYWAYKSFRAELLPSVSLTGGHELRPPGWRQETPRMVESTMWIIIPSPIR